MGGEPRSLEAAARRNVILLAAGMAALYGMIELIFGIAALTFEELGGSDSLAGLAPAIFLVCAALAAAPAGRTMDRLGRRPVLAGGFACGAAGCLLAALGAAQSWLAAALAGFVLAGVATGIVLLSRAAAADMFAPARRPRAIAQVLFGAVFGALLGPLVFSPLLAGEEGGALDLAWAAGAGFMAVGMVVVARLDPDPREIARRLAAGAADGLEAEPPAGGTQPPDHPEGPGQPPAAPLRSVIARPGVAAALLAVLASLAGMAAAMSLAASALVDHGHEHGAVFPVLAAHFVGMFAFFPLVARVVERIGRVAAIATGLVVIAACGVGLAATIASIHLAGLMLFGIGLGWNLSFVAATAELAERAAAGERATLIGFSDLLGNGTGAALVVAGGFALEAVGVGTIAVVSAVLPLLAAVWIIRAPAAPPAPASS